MEKFTLLTSNKDKLKEFKRILPNLTASKGPDLKEVRGDKDEVIIHKVLELGREFHLVEDTVLEIFDRSSKKWDEVVDIKFKLKELKKKSPAVWITSIAYSDGEYIYIFRGGTSGLIDPDRELIGFGFDNLFIPGNSNKSLHELEKDDLKDKFSARRKALLNLKNKIPFSKIKISSIKKWTGGYQGE
jgi:inosine/xanthosine triphosphate pyrophosphatase family protein